MMVRDGSQGNSQPISESSCRHGARNALNTLKGALAVLQGRYAAEKTLGEFLCIMDDEIERLASLISRMSFSATAGRESSDVNAVMRRLESFSRPGKPGSVVPCCASVCGDVPRVAVDELSLAILLLEALHAFKYTAGPAGRTLIKTKRGSNKDSASVVIELGADGRGGARKSSGEAAAGHPLSSVRRTLRHHGGKLQVSRSRGSGTRFRICLPAADGKEVQDRGTENRHRTGGG